MQKQYGKTAEELETLVEGFAYLLAEYGLYDIREAFMRYIKTEPDIPAPSDIIKIIKKIIAEREVTEPSIEKLQRYQKIGMKLTQNQLQRLKSAGVVN